MKTRLIFAFALSAILLSGCGTEERRKLQSTVDSLTMVNNENQYALATLQEVGIMLDSIDANRAILRANMVEGTTIQSYSSRLASINRYVSRTESKIKDLEQRLKSSSRSYVATIKRMKAELDNANKQLAVMREEGMKLRNENGILVAQVMEKDSLLDSQVQYIKVKENELALKEAEAREMSEQHLSNEYPIFIPQLHAFLPHYRKLFVGFVQFSFHPL